MKKVCFLARNLKGGGVRNVIENLLLQLDKEKNIELTLLTDNESFRGKYKNIRIVIMRGHVLFWDNIFSLKYLVNNKFDVIVYPKGTIPFPHKYLSAKKLYIVHDLGYFVKELKAYKGLDTLYMNLLMKFSCNIADVIFAISNYTKGDIIKRFGIQESKIKVAYEGVEENFKKVENKNQIIACLKKYNIDKPYIFYAGSISPRKNILRTLKAFDIIKDKLNVDLVITGNNIWGNTGVNEYINNNLKERVKILGFVSRIELMSLYSGAELYVFPSLYEGFGLPILEAQACGCPVVSSNATSLLEVGGDSVKYFDPCCIKCISDAILEVLKNENKKDNLIKLGYQNIKKYSWQKMTKIIVEEF